jgi:hypothetical protein
LRDIWYDRGLGIPRKGDADMAEFAQKFDRDLLKLEESIKADLASLRLVLEQRTAKNLLESYSQLEHQVIGILEAEKEKLEERVQGLEQQRRLGKIPESLIQSQEERMRGNYERRLKLARITLENFAKRFGIWKEG